MIFLLLSILLSVLTVCFFKLFERYNVHTLQAIIFNYATCILIGNTLSDDVIILQPFWEYPWFGYALLLGFMFISVFYSIGLTSQKMGVSVSMVAAKLSVVIPVGVACLVHGEVMGGFKIGGILLSLVAVFLISRKSDEDVNRQGKWLWLLPVYVFLGSGVIDATLKHMQQEFIPPGNAGDMVSTVFLIAFIIGILVLLTRKETLQLKSIGWGIALGIPNFFCMFFLVKTLENFDATFIFPINNIAIVVCSTIVSLLFFQEKMSVANRIGFALAICSILIISFA
ncbi:MAG: EamA family transporter [Bacteroidota bacterium]